MQGGSEMSRYKVFRAHEHSKHSNRFEVWDTERQQCQGQYVGQEQAQNEADRLNGGGINQYQAAIAAQMLKECGDGN